METDVRWSGSVSCLIFSRSKLNRMDESRHPRRTPTVVLKSSLSLPSIMGRGGGVDREKENLMNFSRAEPKPLETEIQAYYLTDILPFGLL